MALKIVVECGLDGNRFAEHDLPRGYVNDPNFLARRIRKAFCSHNNGQRSVSEE